MDFNPFKKDVAIIFMNTPGGLTQKFYNVIQ